MEPKIVFAPQDRIKALKPYVDQVVQAICAKGAFVSDRSSVGDFWALWYHPQDCLDDNEKAVIEARECALIAQRLALEEVCMEDKIYALAEKLKEKA